MNNDVIPQCGGYLVVRIDRNGYILNYEDEICVHRETRDLHVLTECWLQFSLAKKALARERDLFADPQELALLELTSDGGGYALWMRTDQVDDLSMRRDKFRGCYGDWPIHTFAL